MPLSGNNPVDEIATCIPEEMRYLDVNTFFEEHGFRNMNNFPTVAELVAHLCAAQSTVILVIVDQTDRQVSEHADFVRLIARGILMARIVHKKTPQNSGTATSCDIFIEDDRIDSSLGKIVAELKKRQPQRELYHRWIGFDHIPPSVPLVVAPGASTALSASAADAAAKKQQQQPVQAREEDDRHNALGSFIGRGSLGDVFQSSCDLVGKPMAVKVIDTTKLTAQVAATLVSEINLMRALPPCPQIVRYYYDTLIESQHQRRIYMELCKTSVQHIINTTGAFPLEMAKTCVLDCISGLAFLHERGIIHRDIKPDNLLISYDGVYKLADFSSAIELPPSPKLPPGVATWEAAGFKVPPKAKLSGGRVATGAAGKVAATANGAGPTSVSTSTPASTAGTLLFMSPEMFNGGDYDTATDIWSVGVLLLVLLQALPRDKHGVGAELLPAFFNPDKPDDMDPVILPLHLSKDVQAFLKMCLHRDPEKRATAPELLQTPFLKTTPSGTQGGQAAKTVSKYASQSIRTAVPVVSNNMSHLGHSASQSDVLGFALTGAF